MVYIKFHVAYYSHIVVVFWLLFVVPFQDLDKRNKIILCMDLVYKITLNKKDVICEKIKCLHDDFKILILYWAYVWSIGKTDNLWRAFSLNELSFLFPGLHIIPFLFFLIVISICPHLK